MKITSALIILQIIIIASVQYANSAPAVDSKDDYKYATGNWPEYRQKAFLPGWKWPNLNLDIKLPAMPDGEPEPAGVDNEEVYAE